MKLKTLRSSKGFTLIEIIFVLAIVAVLAGILVPLAISSLSDADKARTRSDEDSIAGAITAFRKDVSQWPDGTGKNIEYLLVGTTKSGTTNEIDTADCPTGGTTTGGFFVNVACTTLTAGSGGTASTFNAFNHLAVNNPNGNTTTDESSGDYNPSKWRGPYLGKVARDTFGRAYVVYTRGIDKNFAGGSTGRGWIISAGTDNTLNTLATDTTVSNDDVGFIFCTKCD